MSMQPASDLRWCAVSAPPAAKKKLPEWARSAALADDGDVFLPAAVAGAEAMVFLCAGYDGTRCILDDDHLYVPARWLATEFPDTAEFCRNAEARTRAHFSAGETP